MFPCSNKAWGEDKVFKILKIQHNLESNFLNHNLGGKGETFCEKVYNKENNYKDRPDKSLKTHVQLNTYIFYKSIDA